MDQCKEIKRAIKLNRNDREYHVQNRKYVTHTYVKMSCTTTQLTLFTF